MRRFCLASALGIAISAVIAVAQQASTAGPYKVLKIDGGMGNL